MKNLNILLAIFVTILSFNAQADSKSIADGTLPITKGAEVYFDTNPRDCHRLREDAALSFYRDLSTAKNLSQPQPFYVVNEAPPNIDGDIQYACNEVIIRTTAVFGEDGTNMTVVRMQSFCVPRTLSEKQLISFAKKCESSPIESCFSENVLRRLDAVKATKLSTDHSSVCTFKINEK